MKRRGAPIIRLDAQPAEVHPTLVADIYLGRQPILDRMGRLSAYELLFRQNWTNAARVTDDRQASAQVLENALGWFGAAGILDGHPGYINIGSGLLRDDVLEVLSPDDFVLEILETVEFDDSLVARCRALRDAGYRLALDDVTPDRHIPDEILKAVDIVKIDLAATVPDDLARLVNRFTRTGKTVLAEKVETQGEFERACRAGCSLFQGYFFARPEVLVARKARNSSGQLLQLMTLLNGDPDLEKLEVALKAHPDIAMHVLRFANATASSAFPAVRTLYDAIARVGTRRLVRWVQLLLYAGSSDVPLRVNPLVQLVVARARFMELAAHRIATGNAAAGDLAAEAYLTGMLSLAHVVLQIDLPELLDQLRVSCAIRGALISREGCLGALLACAEALEIQDEDTLGTVARQWRELDRSAVAELGLSAAQWSVRETNLADGD
ncbi:EAL and HDOD domain-containing protein [Paraburkholderia caballeronis]|uniref:EAL and modified HD-GYP domain-containing signal transduction protein n=1 Tax=Paraburkholderia caballeronis TaxID=416943 RepID=A0A1H7F7F4_9BURK|nr:EAL domain-containing protein [Paraburkholderia caballeronis]PXW23936.1 EAL and modified HD-GYP domain-containing signal transduction protein [Paraburkholderia caballeronis]PXW99700.1 EAL and modified HD-GYP domain-containing signal transduction protein [Paraburkholderia caballeronis]RAJ96654.1 EAL and modified HD-GYP domain-containing signal transduction protein [Paraburkholderia caballeronis]SEE77994.1 EAL and modified HD-GYP domain-containing signal transduction protein [Paraburkholderia 